MKIVLCVTPTFHSETPPLGLAYLKASLIEKGHSVRCLDFSKGYDRLCYPVGPSQHMVDDFDKKDQVVASWVDKIEDLHPDIVGITLWFSNGLTARMLAQAIKRRRPKTVVLGGGPDLLEGDKRAYLECFDYGIENEGEQAICDFVDEYEKTGTISQTRGVWYQVDGEIRSTGPRERIDDLDLLPYPDFSDFALPSYSEGIPVMYSRGCSANCTFCTNKKFFAGQVSRTAHSMYDEILSHTQRTGLRKFIFADDSLLSPTNLEEFSLFCKKVIKGKLDIRWRIYAQRILPSIRKKHVKKMRKAGLESVGFGVESFSKKLRKDMGKTGSNSTTQRVLSDFLDQGIRLNILMLYGYPIETEEDFQESLSWIKQNGRRFSHICFSCFVVNSMYCRKRPGIVTFEEDGRHPYKWRSKDVNLLTKKDRFLRLIEVLDELNVEYMISDPFVTKFYRDWTADSKAEFEEEWNRRSRDP